MNEESCATRLVSWNVNGLRAVMKKGFPQIFSEFGADVVALQETKLQDADRAKLDLDTTRRGTTPSARGTRERRSSAVRSPAASGTALRRTPTTRAASAPSSSTATGS